MTMPSNEISQLEMYPIPESEASAGWSDVRKDYIGISHLTLKRYRCFSKIEVALDPRLTLITAPNGKGKTALLDAVAISLRLFVDTLLKKGSSKGFARDDIQLKVSPGGTMENFLPREPTTLQATGFFWGKRIAWSRELKYASPGSTTTYKDAKQLCLIAEKLLDSNPCTDSVDEEIETERAEFPLISYYGTGRLYSLIKSTSKKKPGKSRLDGYVDCLDPNSSYKAFLAWFGPMNREAQAEKQTGLRSGHQAEQRIKAVSTVITKVLSPTGWCDLRWDFVDQEPIAYHADGSILPVRLLSDGVRNMLAMAADMAFRCSQLNAHLGEDAAALTPGVVLIDEIEMHLHPEWQQVAVPSLLNAFPKLQFIVTTHSPQVVSSVPKKSVRMLVNPTIKDPLTDLVNAWVPEMNPFGQESGRLLPAIFGVSQRPPCGDIEKKLGDYYQALREGAAGMNKAEQILRDLESMGYELNAEEQYKTTLLKRHFNSLANKQEA